MVNDEINGGHAPQQKSRIVVWILAAMAAGLLLGYFLNQGYLHRENSYLKKNTDSLQQTISAMKAAPDSTVSAWKQLAVTKDTLLRRRARTEVIVAKKLEPFDCLTLIFLRLIKMIVAPLVLTTLVVGVAKVGDLKAVGRIGGKTMLWFVSASLVSLLLGMFLVNMFRPGVNMHLPPPVDLDKLPHASLTLNEFIKHLVPASVFDALSQNEILQIVVFSVLFGIATAAIGEKGQVVIRAMDALAHVVLKLTGYVMKVAPVAVFGAMTAIIAKEGIGVIRTYALFIGEFYSGLLLLWCLLLGAGYLAAGRRVPHLLFRLKEPLLLAFSTASSEAAFPKTMLELERAGCPNRIVSFVLPLGYSFNLDGSMMYMTFASLFIAQSYGIHLDMGTQITMLLVLMLTSKGIAGVPRASLVVIAGTLATFHIPEAGLALLLGIDPILDMGRSATNVVGNSVATMVVSRWEESLTR